jgi:hypothetical protein
MPAPCLFGEVCGYRTAGDGEVVAAFGVLGFVDAGGLILGAEPQSDGVFDRQGDHRGSDGRVGGDAERADRLTPQLMPTAAVEQPG